MSLDVKQAILEVNAVRDTDQATERLALFDGVTGAPYPFSGEAWRDIIDEEMENDWHHLVDNPPPQFRKRPNGHVELRGVVAGGSLGVIFTMPETYRHNYIGALHFPVCGQWGFGRFCIMPDGDVCAITKDNQSEWFS